jgi:2-oxoglutarate dehydrogenase E2 component (dihydrolipoamide succinyltransferase)
MPVDITVPQLGESIVEATVGHWLKGEGDAVTAGEPVVELETEKVNMEVAAPAAGALQGIRRREGDTVGIGDVLATVAEGAEAESQPASASAPSAEREVAVARHPSTAAQATAAPSSGDSSGRATHVARRMAEEQGIDLRQVTGTGRGGQITHDDVAAYAKNRGNGAGQAASPAPAASAALAAASSPVSAPAISPALPAAAPEAPQAAVPAQTASAAPTSGRVEERIRMSRRRLTIARRLVEAQHTAAMLTTFNEVDMTAIMALRQRRRETFKERHGVGLGYMSFFTRAVVGALKAFPRLNAEIQAEEMVLKRYYDIGIAVSTPEGLVVPVLRDADRLTFAEIEQQIAALAQKARDKTLSLDELQGGTFTITNGGVFGSLLSTPILNGPQVGILGMHKIEERPIAQGGQVVIHPMMYLAVSYDHRIVDGAEAVSFLVRVKELLEDPETLLLEG